MHKLIEGAKKNTETNCGDPGKYELNYQWKG